MLELSNSCRKLCINFPCNKNYSKNKYNEIASVE